jgi:hypothetical protein
VQCLQPKYLKGDRKEKTMMAKGYQSILAEVADFARQLLD